MPTPFGDLVAVTGNLTTIIGTNPLPSIRWLGYSLNDIIKLTVYGNVDIEPYIPVIGYVDNKPVKRYPVIAKYKTDNNLLIVELADIDTEFVRIGSTTLCDMDDFVYAYGNIDDVKSYGLDKLIYSSKMDVLETDMMDMIWSGSSRYGKLRSDDVDVKYGSSTLPYKNQQANSVKLGNYIYTYNFLPLCFDGKVDNDPISRCIKNVLLSVKYFNIDHTHCYRLRIRGRNINMELVKEKLSIFWGDTSLPIIDYAKADVDIAMGGIFYMEDVYII
jgi:hypothetical protein